MTFKVTSYSLAVEYVEGWPYAHHFCLVSRLEKRGKGVSDVHDYRIRGHGPP